MAEPTTARLEVALPGQPHSYPILIAQNLLDEVGTRMRELLPAPRKVLIITDDTVAPLYSQRVQASLEGAGYSVSLHVIDSGEASKSLATAESIWQTAILAGFKRRDIMLALGGGVVGDLAGFCAATYYRGLAFVQVPTTLLSQVDSSVGGKVAVNFSTVKNGIGAFYQPALVLMDPATLSSLSPRAYRAGVAEVVKYALIEHKADNQTHFWPFLQHHKALLQPEAPNNPKLANDFARMLARCCAIKAAVVRADEHETTGLRAILNLGHTVGHALEAAGDYNTLLHGEAVALGTLVAYDVAARLERIPHELADEVKGWYEEWGVLDSMPGLPQSKAFTPEALIALMRQDKKADDDSRLVMILPEGKALGNVSRVDDVPTDVIEAVLSERLS